MTILKDKELITFKITKRKNQKNLRIRIMPSGEIIASGNDKTSDETIAEFVKSKADWIIKARNKIASAIDLNSASEFKDGAEIKLFGENYKIKIKTAENGGYKTRGEVLELTSATESEAENELFKFVAELSRVKFGEYLTEYLAKAAELNLGSAAIIAPPPLRLNFMRSKWGYLKYKGGVPVELALNFALATLPERLARYVAAHETAHIFVKSHGANFYALGEKLYPNFKAADRELNKVEIKFWR